MVMSKAKGNLFENDLMKQCRTVNKDSYRTIGSGNSSDDKGDIIFGDYMIEAKHHKDFTDAELEGYFKKVEKEAQDFGKIPLVVFKVNRRKAKVMFKLSDGRFAWMNWSDFLEREDEKARHK